MMRELEHVNWNVITSNEKTSDEMLSEFYEVIYPLFGKCFPRVKLKLSTRDLPFTSPLVKHLLERGKNAIKKHDLELSNLFEEKINSLIRENQMRAVRQESNNHITGSKKWWDTVNRITSRTKLNISLSTQLDSSDINAHFQKTNTDCNYKPSDLCEIPEGTRIPSLSINMVRQLLDNLRKTTVGPDDIPYWFWRNFSSDLTPVVTMIFNRSLAEGIVPDMWKKCKDTTISKRIPASPNPRDL